jgi:hypothetical protein
MLLKNLKNGTVSITGVSHGDLRLMANAIEEGAFAGGDRGGEVSQALLRLASALRTPARYEGSIGNIEIISGVADASLLYEEV